MLLKSGLINNNKENKMRCLSCNVILDDKEQVRKYKNHEEIPNPEDKYLGLCNRCLGEAQFDDNELEAYIPDDFREML
jgi:hypothetical protein